jgi:hypothetical protein
MNEPKKLNPRPTSVVLVGAGGVGVQLAPTLVKLLRQFPPLLELIIIDGDKLEERNLDRQLFRKEQVGQYKAEALTDLLTPSYLKVRPVVEWFVEGYPVDQGALLLSCVDNHAARRAILSMADQVRGYAILGGNEYTDCEAFFYSHEWSGTPADPRVYYPLILTDNTDDPVRAGAGCQGQILERHPQLALANMGAAYYMAHLFWFWFVEGQTLDPEVWKYCPVRHHNNFTRCGTVMRGEITQPKQPLKELHETPTLQEEEETIGNPA